KRARSAGTWSRSPDAVGDAPGSLRAIANRLTAEDALRRAAFTNSQVHPGSDRPPGGAARSAVNPPWGNAARFRLTPPRTRNSSQRRAQRNFVKWRNTKTGIIAGAVYR